MEIGGVEMKTKTCGDCKHFMDGRCIYGDDPFEVEKDSPYCDDRFFKPAPKPTNGDVVRQGNNRKLAEIFDDLYNGNKCKYCIHHAGSGVCKLTNQHAEYDEGEFDEDEVCVDGFEAWLNTPAEINTEREE